MSAYEEMAEAAAEMLAEYGQRGLVRRVVMTGGGPSDPAGGTETIVEYSAHMAVFPVDLMREDRIDGTNVKSGDFQVICEAIETELTADDRLICDQGTLTIVRLGRIAPAGVTVAYDMVARGG